MNSCPSLKANNYFFLSTIYIYIIITLCFVQRKLSEYSKKIATLLFKLISFPCKPPAHTGFIKHNLHPPPPPPLPPPTLSSIRLEHVECEQSAWARHQYQTCERAVTGMRTELECELIPKQCMSVSNLLV